MTVYQRLTRPLLALSNAADYEEAKHEWRTTGEVWDGDYTLPDEHRTKHPGHCLCGKTIRWHFEIENTENGNIDIVGSDCVHHWMVLRHLTEVEGLDPSEVTEERIQEWIELNVNKLKKNAWFRMHGEMFEDIWEAVADIDLRVNVKVVSQYWDYVTERHEPKFILRRRARGKPGDKHYRMASIVWRWNHPDNPKNQQTKYGFPNDRLWVDMLMFNAHLEEVIDKLGKVEQNRESRIEQVEARKALSAEMRDEFDDEEFATNLVTWAEVIRKTFYDGGVDEVISTRRLDHIVKAFTIFGDKMKAIELCVARFDEDTKESFLDLYTKIDAGVITSPSDETPVSEESVTEE